MPSESRVNDSNLNIEESQESEEDMSIEKAVDRLRKFPLLPVTGKSRNSPIANTKKRRNIVPKTSTPLTTGVRKKNTSLSSTPDDSSSDVTQIDVFSSLNELITIFKGLANHIVKFGTVLSKLEMSLQSTSYKVNKLEEELTATRTRYEDELNATRTRCSELERRVDVLEGRNAHLFERINSLNLQSETAPSSSPPIAPDKFDKLQDQLDHIHQSKRSCDIIVTGKLIEQRITKELDCGKISVRDLCIDIISRIYGLEDAAHYIGWCQRLEGDHPKLLVKLSSHAYRGKIFSHFFRIKKKPFFINENLIPSRAKMFHELRLLQRTKKNFIDKSFSKHGEIYYILHGTNELIKLSPQKLLLLMKMFINN